MLIREALPADIPAIQAIYAHHVRHGVGTFEEVPPDPATMAGRMRTGRAAGGHWLVAEAPAGGPTAGYAYYGPYRARSAYRFAVEDSVYIRDDARGTGVGTALLSALVEHATAAGYRQMIAAIGSSDNAGSISLHTRLGFTRSGVLRDVGFKFDRWLDVVLMQRELAGGPVGPAR
ncbi:GNAT family N-acetyltransferase [Pseudonocardia acidicola]|uniref:N-acetyltransferase n=1 Tax=Pseudonocardia acidicola TaxID=2724939 RepID=A0ABX1SJJ5_9PSEU|nr:GNAT family N-acetyltransferase [Pseudonocardia acidicola]NMI01236.1 N-acetyltransferase [Pseudonocardia acidicola]